MNEETRLLNELEDFRPRSLEAAYPAALAPRIDTDPAVPWAVAVPDLPGCIAEGATQEEAMTNAVEAVETWIAGRKGETAGGPVPSPTSIDTWARVPKYAGWTWFLVGTRRLTEADRDQVEAVLDEAADAPPAPAVGVEVVALPVPEAD